MRGWSDGSGPVLRGARMGASIGALLSIAIGGQVFARKACLLGPAAGGESGLGLAAEPPPHDAPAAA